MSATHMVVIWADDWAGLFVGGALYDETHNIQIETLVRASKGQPFTLEVLSEPPGIYEYLSTFGRFGHHNLAEVMEKLEGYSK